jgi:adenosylcobinamide kinase / adenosylcobinamide-phosphate guanylyltransferase
VDKTSSSSNDNARPDLRLPALTLVLGGARSGKSARAEALIASHLNADTAAHRATYIATAEAGDREMAQRIADHRERRGDQWRTVETLLALGDALVESTAHGEPVLVDCLTLWLSNVMHAELDVAAETETLRAALDRARGPVVCVSNEVGLGIVPATKLGRGFRDAAGRLNQFMAAQADRVEFIAAGLPITLKNETS